MANKKYSKEFKLEALSLAEQVGSAQAARSLGIPANMVYRWRQEQKQSGEEAFRGNGNMTAQEAELVRLRREVANLKEDREILKKALEIFSQKNHKYV
jgi:transposase